MNKGQKIALITFGLFMTEAIIHYNLGKTNTEIKMQVGEEDNKWLPSTKTLIHLGIVVGIFSIINGVVIKNVVD